MRRLVPTVVKLSAFQRHFATTRLALKVVPFKLADIGEGILKVEVLQVFVKPGDTIQEFDKICEVQSDKATVEITSRFNGVIENLYVSVGATANVGSVIADIDVGSKNDAVPQAAVVTSSTQVAAAPVKQGTRVLPFKLADIGEGILKVEVLQVFVKPGDTIQEFDKICEVQSDKATVEITSRFNGVIKNLYVSVGATANVGSVIADIETEGASYSAAEVVEAPKDSTTTSAERIANANGKVLATPSTRRIAKENNIDLSRVPATGKGGRIMKEDVLKFIETGGLTASSASPTVTTVTPAEAAKPSAAYGMTVGEDRVVVLAGIRKAMVKSMTEANKIPCFGASDEIEITKLMALREEMKPLMKTFGSDAKLTFMPFFLKAASMALKRFPELNAHTNEDCSQVIVKGSHNIGFAMDTPNGLVVPNIKNIEQKSLFDIAVEMTVLMKKGQKNSFSPADFSGGTFTISNIGSIGATYTKPVIFPPQVVIGAIGKLQTLPRFDANGNVVKANIINISWSADHRVVDGATMVRYNNLFKDYLERPGLMLLQSK